MTQQNKKLNFFMYSLLFVCFFTSGDWNHINPAGEILRFDFIRIGGLINIYNLFTIIFSFLIFHKKFVTKNAGELWGDGNYLKNIFLLYLVPVNLLIYFTIIINDIQLLGTGLKPFMNSFTYFVVILYAQDIFFRNKNSAQLSRVLTIVELLIFIRCIYSIGKYFLGFGHYVETLGFMRIGQENDFADYFILMLIIALTRLLFGKNESKMERFLHIVAVAASSFISLMSARRYLWGELLIAWGVILFAHYRYNRAGVNQKVVITCLILVTMFSFILVVGPGKLMENYYFGRFISILSLVDEKYENEFGEENLHKSEIREGWENVKKHWLLGVTYAGAGLMDRKVTKYQLFTFVHNAYLAVWLNHGLLGLILFLALYIKSLQLGHFMFFKLKRETGLILLTFMVCQIIKNIVWPTAMENMNITIIYIFLISLVLRKKQLISVQKMDNIRQGKLSLIPV